ncbi:transmembrane amino acid transporter protein-domain-containing protein [Aspergillus alliaceus]|uniref:Transmembrane amino acid transporter protein-domain-containing protein n=1 Tax=Petromyces alliaceus TaxID=209559 RepID=A0A5N7CIM8_PETAA|nr:transmembrane amino acid transporter protein-domain-containing protein [Aspergillus alliaceus]
MTNEKAEAYTAYDREQASPHGSTFEEHEVFKKTDTGVNFRKVGWFNAGVIFIKILFATGVLSLPSALYSLGAVGGSISIVAWGCFNTYCAVILGNFRTRHPHCHSIADMAEVLGGVVAKEATGLLFIIAYILVTGSGIIGVTTALNALSHHATCTVWWSLIATVIIIATACIRKLEHVGWLTYAGFISIYAAVLIVVIGVTTQDRPAAAPQEGPYELGFVAVNNPGFAAGMVASCTIFVSSAGTSAFLPVISEMRNPKDYKKPLYFCMALVTASYLAFSLVVYRWCGKWVASPSLGSAGQTIKMVSYGVALVGLIVSATLYLHVAAKYVFVRILGNSRHLQANTVIHWGTWVASTVILGALSFILAEAIPIFNYLIALVGSVCFAPLAMSLPGCLWLYDHWHYKNGTLKEKVVFLLHCGLVLLGLFFLVGATYGVVIQIIDAYSSGTIGSAFSCADNSNSS